ncbi:MAG: recombinase family protein [Candidatus Moranbacteria bacterium]|nr:recombinase family protein [Candidatus Moranbacteria bacterium]
MNNAKCLIYARVSSKEQEDTGYSLDAQEKLLQDYARKNDFGVKKAFRVSESASGKQIRKTFNELLSYADKNKISIILCEKIDRLTRNLKDAASVSDWINEDSKREVHFVKESFIVNKNTRAHENLVWDMKVAIARFYTNNLSEEVRKGQKEKISQGWLPAKPPVGYRTIGEKGHKTHIIDESSAPLVRKMFELYSSGNYSLNALAATMHKEGLRNREGGTIGKSRMHEQLSDPFYYGKIRWNDEIYEGQHEPLISKELFEAVQAKLIRNTDNPQYKTHLPVFKAKIKCDECGGIIAWETQKGHWYGHCNHFRKCSQKTYVRQERVEDQLFPLFEGVAPKNERVLGWLIKAMKESHKDEIDYNTQKRESFSRIVRTADKRIEEAYKDKLDGKMPATLCEKVMKDTAKEKEAAIEELKKLSKSRTAYYEAGFAIHELALKAKAVYESPKAKQDDKRLLLSYAFSNLALKADKISPNYTLAFEFMAEWMPKLNRTFELEEISINKAKKGISASPCPVLLPGQDSNL